MKKLILISLLLVPSIVNTQEKITQTTQVQPSITNFRPISLHIEVDPNPLITIVIAGEDNKNIIFQYPNATVAAYSTNAQVLTLINQLKTANFSTTYVGTFAAGNLWQRMFFRLCTDFPSRFPNGCSVS